MKIYALHPSHETQLAQGATPDEGDSISCLRCEVGNFFLLSQPCRVRPPLRLKESGAISRHILSRGTSASQGVASLFYVMPDGSVWAGIRYKDRRWWTVHSNGKPSVSRGEGPGRVRVEGKTLDGEPFSFDTDDTVPEAGE